MVQAMSGNWKVQFPCTRAEAEALHEDDEWFALLDPMPTIVAEEVEAFNDDKWQLNAYFAAKPKKAVIKAIQSRLSSTVKASLTFELRSLSTRHNNETVQAATCDQMFVVRCKFRIRPYSY